jgi:tRNA-dihydrouridine synthase
VKQATRIPVIAVGLITEFEQAEAIVGTGDADLIALARTILFNPRWPWHAAAHFGAHVKAPEQYLRSQPRQYRDLFDMGIEIERHLIADSRRHYFGAVSASLSPPASTL